MLRELQHYPQVVVDIVRLSIWLLLLTMIFVPLERLFANTPQKVFRKGWLTDLVFYFINGVLVKVALVFPMAAIAWALRHVVPGAVHLAIAEFPLWARLGAALVAGELGFYWGHRWTHEVPLLWRFHSIHTVRSRLTGWSTPRGIPSTSYLRACADSCRCTR